MNGYSSCPGNLPIRVKLSVHDKMLFKPTMDTLVDYTNPLLDSYRSSTHDAILVYGFIPDRASSGAFKTSFTLQDGLKYEKYCWNQTWYLLVIGAHGQTVRQHVMLVSGQDPEHVRLIPSGMALKVLKMSNATLLHVRFVNFIILFSKSRFRSTRVFGLGCVVIMQSNVWWWRANEISNMWCLL